MIFLYNIEMIHYLLTNIAQIRSFISKSGLFTNISDLFKHLHFFYVKQCTMILHKKKLKALK